MIANTPILVTGAAGQVGAVGRLVTHLILDRGLPVRAMVHRDDERAAALRGAGAEVVVGDLLEPADVYRVVSDCRRVYFSMSVSAGYLEATVTMAAVARELGVEALVNMSQMTVSQMTATSTEESKQQRLHWLAEHVINWSGVPAVHIRPTVLLENPLFAMLAARSIHDTGQLILPFGTGRTSPVASSDVAQVVTAVLSAPQDHLGAVYELTGPATLDIDELAEQYAQALDRPVAAVSPLNDDWLKGLDEVGLDPHTRQHIATMAKLHRRDRYNRSTHDVETITGHPAQTVRQYIERHRDLFR